MEVRAEVLSVMDPGVLLPKRRYWGFLSLLNFYFCIYFFLEMLDVAFGGKTLYSDVSFWTVWRPCVRNMNLRLGVIA